MASLGISISLDAELVSALQSEALECNITLQDVIRSVLRHHVMETTNGE